MSPPTLTLDRNVNGHLNRLWRNMPEVNRWTRQNGLLSEADQDRWDERIHSDPSILMFGIRNEEGQYVGCAGLTSISHVHRSAEFSLFIGPPHQKKGYGREALLQLFTYGFVHLDLEIIWGETFQSNPARALFNAVGMMEEGIHRSRYYKYGKRVDSVSISILRNEFFHHHPDRFPK